MERVDFFTAVSFGDRPRSCSQSLLEIVDSYFYLNGKKAYVIPENTQQNSEGVVVLTKDSPAFLTTALKVVSYLTIALPVVMLILKAILRSIHSFHIIDVTQKVEEGILIDESTIETIRSLLSKIEKRENDDKITWHTAQHPVFSLNSIPHLIFKLVPDADKRFENMVNAKKICLGYQLNSLIIPHAKKFIVNDSILIAEECLSFQPHHSAQEQLYSELSNLDETIRQLAIFIAKTGFSDVDWYNIPIVDNSRCIALVDLEEMDEAVVGFFGGGLGRRGLVRCLFSDKQMDIALAEARRHGIAPRGTTPETVKVLRKQEIAKYQQLQNFYTKHGILQNARKPIQVDDLATLGLNLEEQGECETRSFTLRQATEDVIAQINRAINKAPANASIKGMRRIVLDTNKGTLLDYCTIRDSRIPLSHDIASQSWMARIIHALVTTGHLFQLECANGHGYHIQA